MTLIAVTLPDGTTQPLFVPDGWSFFVYQGELLRRDPAAPGANTPQIQQWYAGKWRAVPVMAEAAA
jgi:hypothetical protein